MEETASLSFIGNMVKIMMTLRIKTVTFCFLYLKKCEQAYNLVKLFIFYFVYKVGPLPSEKTCFFLLSKAFLK